MSISDETMWLWFELISFRTMDEIKKLRDDVNTGMNPRDVKFLLGEELAARFHNADAAKQARENFIAQFQKGQMPEDMPEINIMVGDKGMPITHIIKTAGLTDSTSEATRLLQQGAVRVDGEKISDRNLLIQAKKTIILQVGRRRFAKVTLE
jgi:tyrosyl-tRNA synthetase